MKNPLNLKSIDNGETKNIMSREKLIELIL